MYSGMLYSLKFTDVSEVLSASIIRVIILMMEAGSTSEMSVIFYRLDGMTSQNTVINTFSLLLGSTIIVLSMSVYFVSELSFLWSGLSNGMAKQVFAGQKTFFAALFLLHMYTARTVLTTEKCYL
jgi:hypothetical protein